MTIINIQTGTGLIPYDVRQEAQYYLDLSLSKNTKLNYACDLKNFREWGGSLPTSTEIMMQYVIHSAGQYNPRTIVRRMQTIRHWHKLNGVADPTDDMQFKQIMKGIRNDKGKRLKKATPFTKKDIDYIDKCLTDRGRLIDLRNNALMQIGFYGAFRRSELVAIKFEHLRPTDEGTEIFIPYSKTDQEAQGETCAIPYFESSPCPNETLAKWLEAADIRSGSIFRSFTSSMKVTNNALAPGDVTIIVKNIVKDFDIGDPKLYSSHSLRRGFATAATHAGAGIDSIMRQGRWKHSNTVMGYIDDANKFKSNAASLMDC